MNQTTRIINSIKTLYDLIGLDTPNHPLIAVLKLQDIKNKDMLTGKDVVFNMYTICLKDKDNGFHLARRNYNFDTGNMAFTAPNQRLYFSNTEHLSETNGWMLLFHPDLIRNTLLEEKIENYMFFSHDIKKAINLSETEQFVSSNCIELIENEIKGFKDNYSKTVYVSILELLLNFCARFYEKEFNTNTKPIENNSLVSKVRIILKEYYDQNLFITKGIPNVEDLATKVGVTPNYLGDFLKKETGKSAKDYVNSYIIEKAKRLLIKDNTPVSKISYDLGFNYPHYFSRLFKSKTGMTPKKYRDNY